MKSTERRELSQHLKEGSHTYYLSSKKVLLSLELDSSEIESTYSFLSDSSANMINNIPRIARTPFFVEVSRSKIFNKSQSGVV